VTQDRSGHCGEDMKSCPCRNSKPGRPASSPSLYQLIYIYIIYSLYIFFGIVGGGVHLGPLGTAATNRPIVSAPGDFDDGEIGGMIGKGNRSTRRKAAPVLLCPPQTPHAARTRTRVAAVGSQRLTAELRHGLSLCMLHPVKSERPF
jgi:hypothetical protein